jgi:hypothetical protein
MVKMKEKVLEILTYIFAVALTVGIIIASIMSLDSCYKVRKNFDYNVNFEQIDNNALEP